MTISFFVMFPIAEKLSTPFTELLLRKIGAAWSLELLLVRRTYQRDGEVLEVQSRNNMSWRQAWSLQLTTLDDTWRHSAGLIGEVILPITWTKFGLPGKSGISSVVSPSLVSTSPLRYPHTPLCYIALLLRLAKPCLLWIFCLTNTVMNTAIFTFAPDGSYCIHLASVEHHTSVTPVPDWTFHSL